MDRDEIIQALLTIWSRHSAIEALIDEGDEHICTVCQDRSRAIESLLDRLKAPQDAIVDEGKLVNDPRAEARRAEARDIVSKLEDLIGPITKSAEICRAIRALVSPWLRDVATVTEKDVEAVVTFPDELDDKLVGLHRDHEWLAKRAGGVKFDVFGQHALDLKVRAIEALDKLAAQDFDAAERAVAMLQLEANRAERVVQLRSRPAIQVESQPEALS